MKINTPIEPLLKKASVATISPDFTNFFEVFLYTRKDYLSTEVIAMGSRMNPDDKYQTQGIYCDMALSAFTLFSSIVAPDPPFTEVLTV